MIKLRLLKEKTPQVYQQLESVDIPSIENVNEVNTIAVAIGKILTKYSDVVSDPNMISSLVDSSIENWTIRDIESVQAALMLSNLKLTVTDEDQVDEPTEQGDVIYLMVDESVKVLGIIPVGTYTVIKGNPQAVDIVSVMENLIPKMYFDTNKFLNNPITALLENMKESKTLVGAYDAYSLGKLYRILDVINKQLITITVV